MIVGRELGQRLLRIVRDDKKQIGGTHFGRGQILALLVQLRCIEIAQIPTADKAIAMWYSPCAFQSTEMMIASMTRTKIYVGCIEKISQSSPGFPENTRI